MGSASSTPGAADQALTEELRKVKEQFEEMKQNRQQNVANAAQTWQTAANKEEEQVEKRMGPDGQMHPLTDFISYYGQQQGLLHWSQADPTKTAQHSTNYSLQSSDPYVQTNLSTAAQNLVQTIQQRAASHQPAYQSEYTVHPEGGEYAVHPEGGPAQRKDLRKQYYGEDPYVQTDRSSANDDASDPYDPYGSAAEVQDVLSTPKTAAPPDALKRKKGYLQQLEDMSNVARQTVDQLFEILPYCSQDAGAASLVMDLLRNTGFIPADARDKDGNTLLIVACKYRNPAVVRILIGLDGMKVNAKNLNNETALHFACNANSFSLEIAEILLSKGAVTSIKEGTAQCTPLHNAASVSEPKLVELLLKHGADPTPPDKDGYLPENYAQQSMLTTQEAALKAARARWEQRGGTPEVAVAPAPAPAAAADEWEIHTDEASGCQYRFNPVTGETQWLDDTDSKQEEVVEDDGPSVEEQLRREEQEKQKRLKEVLLDAELANAPPLDEGEERALVAILPDVLEREGMLYKSAVDFDSRSTLESGTPGAEGKSEDADTKSETKENEITEPKVSKVAVDAVAREHASKHEFDDHTAEEAASNRFVASVPLVRTWFRAVHREGALRLARRVRPHISELERKLKELKTEIKRARQESQKQLREAKAELAAVQDDAEQGASVLMTSLEVERGEHASKEETLNQQIADLKKRVDSMRTQAAEGVVLGKERERLSKQVRELRMELETHKSKSARELSETKLALRIAEEEAVTEKEMRSRAVEDERNNVETVRAKLQARVKAVQAQLASAQEEASKGTRFQGEIENLKSKIVTLEAEATTARTEATAATAATRGVKKELEAAKSELAASSKALADAKAAALATQQDLEGQLRDLKSQLESATQSLVSSKESESTAVGELTAKVQSLLSDLNAAQAKVTDMERLQRELSAANAEVAAAKQLDAEKAGISKGKLGEMEAQIEALTKQLQESKEAHRKELAAEKDARAAADTESSAKLATLQQQMTSLGAQVSEGADLGKEADQLRSDLRTVREKLMAAETEAAKSATRANTLGKDLEAAREEIAKLKQELESKEAAAADKLQAIEAQLVAATDKAKSDKEEFEQETKRLKESHKQTVATLNEKIDEMSTQMTALRSRAADGDLAVAKANELQEELDRVHRDHEKIIAQQTEEARSKMRREIRRAQDEANNRVALARMDCDQIVAKIKKKNQQLLERWQKEQALRRKYYNQLEDMKGKIRVYARVRPLSKKELKMKKGADGSAAPCDMAIVCQDKYSCSLKMRTGKKHYEFDRVFAPDSLQKEVFADTKRLMQTAIDGFNVCIFAYGQTGSGKTFTMTGEGGGDGELLGIGPRAINEIFRIVVKDQRKFEFKLRVSMYELYRNNLIDLLQSKRKHPPPLEIKMDTDGRVYVEGGLVVDITDAQSLGQAFSQGMKRRHVGKTKMNDASSRSHLVQQIFIESLNKHNKVTTLGKLTMVDLAGSERQSKTGAEGARFEEAKAINKSLSALGNVISALTTNSKHVPYRDSKLTELMRDCIGGNAKTLMFVNLSPADYNANEGMSSLNFAQRCKKVRNQATAAVESKALRKLKNELARLKQR